MLTSNLIVRSQMLTLSSLTAVEQRRGGLELQPLLCAQSFKEARAADVTHTYTHTPVSISDLIRRKDYIIWFMLII